MTARLEAKSAVLDERHTFLVATFQALIACKPVYIALDIEQGVDPFDSLQRNRRDRRGVVSTTIVMVAHDLNRRPADHVVTIFGGSIHAVGPLRDLATPQLIRTVFGVEAMMIPHPADGGSPPIDYPRRLKEISKSS